MNERLWLDHIETPLGELALVADGAGRLRALGWTDGHARMQRTLAGVFSDSPVPAPNPGGLSAAIRAYFAGDLTAIDGLPGRGRPKLARVAAGLAAVITRYARTGRAMFLSACSPISSKARSRRPAASS